MKLTENEGIGKILADFVNCIWLGLLWLACSLPLVTLGASTTALYYAVVKGVRHDRGTPTRLFFSAFRENFKTATLTWLLCAGFLAVVTADIVILRGALLRRVAIVGHLTVNAFGTDYTDASGYEHEYATEVIRLMEQGVDAIIPGEVIDWTAISYIRDAVQQGRNKAVFNVGHYNWEEPGMSYMAEWLAELLGDEVPVRFVPAGDIYRFD